MRPGLAVSILLTGIVSAFGAGTTVLVEWVRMPGSTEPISPAMWAAREYLACFDVWAIMVFVPCFVCCRRLRGRLRAQLGAVNH